jgi:hypothetical protein
MRFVGYATIQGMFHERISTRQFLRFLHSVGSVKWKRNLICVRQELNFKYLFLSVSVFGIRMEALSFNERASERRDRRQLIQRVSVAEIRKSRSQEYRSQRHPVVRWPQSR